MMRRALMQLNVYGHEAVQQKLKNRQKVPKKHFLAVFELLLDSLTGIYLELHQCPWHHSILPTQGQFMKFSQKILRIGGFEKLFFFCFGLFESFFHHPHENQSEIMCQNRWDSIFMIMMVYSKNSFTQTFQRAVYQFSIKKNQFLFGMDKLCTESLGESRVFFIAVLHEQ